MARLELDGVPATTLARRWGVPQCGLFHLVASTLDGIHELAAQAAPPGTVLIAEEQTAGRGRGGRTWHSPAGGVWLGMLLQPSHGELGVMSIRAGLVLADVVDDLVGRPVAQLKWPNDIVVRDRKLAGILCEGRWQGDVLQWLGLGIGVNTCNAIPAEVADQAIALRELLPHVRRIDVLDCLVPALLLQPLVENALRHGIELSSNPGLVRVVVKRQGRRLVLSVEDNGVGLAGTGNPPGPGIGLSNT